MAQSSHHGSTPSSSSRVPRGHVACSDTVRTENRAAERPVLRPDGVQPTEQAEHEEVATMRLKGKVAVIYGAGGAIGGAVARAFGSQGARLFLAGRHGGPVEAVADGV